MTALASFSEGNTVNLVSKAALLSPIASLGHITSSIASAASYLFVDEVFYQHDYSLFQLHTTRAFVEASSYPLGFNSMKINDFLIIFSHSYDGAICVQILLLAGVAEFNAYR